MAEAGGENKFHTLHQRTTSNCHNRVPCNTCKFLVAIGFQSNTEFWYTRIFWESRRRSSTVCPVQGVSVGGAPSSARPNVFCYTRFLR
jgi:hypothetical protein